MTRLAPTALVLALLAATAIAFVRSERLKLEPTPITKTRIPNRVFSPVCGCRTRVAPIEFVLRTFGRMRVVVVDERGKVVRRLADHYFRRGPVHLAWDGRDDEGRIVPEDGTYRPRVHLSRHGRTILLPVPIRVDVTPPAIALRSVRPTTFSPDGDRRRDAIAVAYHMTEPAHAVLLVDGTRRVRSLWQRLDGTLYWYGLVAGRPVRAGDHRVTLVARDLAGNLSRPTPPETVTVRYVALPTRVLHVPTGARFRVPVTTDAVNVRWRLGRRSGVLPADEVVLRAPSTPGRYPLEVSERGRGATATVVVRRPR